jgi:hypothetical protein
MGMGMSLRLSPQDLAMLEGRHGRAAQFAMSIIVRMAEVDGADELLDVTQAHIDSVSILSDSMLEFAETLVAWGAQVRVPTTLNMVPLDTQRWRELGIAKEVAHRALRQIRAFTQVGCIPTCTCAPYEGYLTPRFGQHIAWAESNAIVYANSVLGARTNRYGDYLDICAAITGRVPRQGLHLTENRKGQLLLKLAGVPPALLGDNSFYPVLGHFIGRTAQDQIPVITGLPPTTTSEQLKALGAAAASAGAVALFHAVGLTPEARTLAQAFQDSAPPRVIEVGLSDLQAARAELSTASAADHLDAVVLGCPHFSFPEFQDLARAIREQQGQCVHPGVRFLVLTQQIAYSLLQRTDLLEVLTAFGVDIVLDTCVFSSPLLAAGVRVVMTNSGKHAYYAPGGLGVSVAYGSLADCVQSAVLGVVWREERAWAGS